MCKYIKYIFLLALVLISVFLGLYQITQAAGLILDYPEIQGLKPGLGTGETSDLPSIIKYIYLFSLGLVGVVALLSMIIGGIKYIFSAGNASIAGDAKDQIYSAILGIIILLASVIILRTINPDLVNIGFALEKITPQQPIGDETASYRCLCCVYDIHGNNSCTPTQAITNAQYWPQTCNTISIAQADISCKYACYAKNCVLPFEDPQNQMIKCVYKLSSCQ